MTNINPTAERHINSLNNNGALIKVPDGSTEPISMDFYRRAVEQCIQDGYNAISYELVLPGIDGDFQIAFWKDGHVDSGSTRRIIDCLASLSHQWLYHSSKSNFKQKS